ncbi:MAG: hypothetical protein ACRC9Q_02555 [Bacteroidales bacterium]
MKREIDIILDNLEELQALVKAMSQEKEIPSILFRFSYDKTTKIETLLKDLEQAQLLRDEQEVTASVGISAGDATTFATVSHAVALAGESLPEQEDISEVLLKEPAAPVSAEILADVLCKENDSVLQVETPEPIVESSVKIEDTSQKVVACVPEEDDIRTKEHPETFAVNADLEPLKEKTEEVSEMGTRSTDSFLTFQAKATLNERIQRQLSTDFRQAISLNDRFRFMRELFNNDSVIMDECIERVNQSTDYNGTEQELLITYKWNKEQEEVVEFFNLIRQRFV